MKRATAAILLVGLLSTPAADAQEPPSDGLEGRTVDSLPVPESSVPRIASPGVSIERLDLTRTPLVEARVTVVDAGGNWVHGLRADEFEVRLDERPVDLDGDRARLASRFVDGEHLTALMIVDVSGSMRTAFPEIRGAIADFAARLGEADEIGLVTVAEAPRIPIPAGVERGRLLALLDSLPLGGHTAILDAVVAGIDSLAARGVPRRALIVLSDGVDNRSASSLEKAAIRARDRGIPIYAIALGAADTAALTTLASASGGRVLGGVEPGELRRIYADIAGLLEGEYRLSLRLDDDAVDRWHDLSVELRSPPPGVTVAPAMAERPFLASRTPGVDRDLVSSARTEHRRERLLVWWALGSLVALVPTLGVVLIASRSTRIRLGAGSIALAVALAGALGGLGAMLWLALAR